MKEFEKGKSRMFDLRIYGPVPLKIYSTKEEMVSKP